MASEHTGPEPVVWRPKQWAAGWYWLQVVGWTVCFSLHPAYSILLGRRWHDPAWPTWNVPWVDVALHSAALATVLLMVRVAYLRERNVSVRLHPRGLILSDWRGRQTRIGWARVRSAYLAHDWVPMDEYAWLDCVDGPVALGARVVDPASLVVAINDRLAELRG